MNGWEWVAVVWVVGSVPAALLTGRHLRARPAPEFPTMPAGTRDGDVVIATFTTADGRTRRYATNDLGRTWHPHPPD